jgi:hypothetical protein
MGTRQRLGVLGGTALSSPNTKSDSAPPPDLRIVPLDRVHPHETHDSQRSGPLLERLRTADTVIHPPIVAPMDDGHYVILDGANRCYCFGQLGYEHIVVQCASYDSGTVELSTWQHIVSDFEAEEFLHRLRAVEAVELLDHQDAHALAHLVFKDGRVLAVRAALGNAHERNSALRDVVGVYQQAARLYRTALDEPQEVWRLYPEAIALVFFARYEPADIIAAARYDAPLPPGVSRHIVNGRALRINYPTAALRDTTLSLEAKNEALQTWLKEKLAKRQVRYYAEATYQFDE